MRRKKENNGYIWQRGGWPEFVIDYERLIEPIGRLNHLQGVLGGRMSMLGFNEQSRTSLTALTESLLNTSEIEGVKLNPQSVRSSIARRLGLSVDGAVTEDHYVEGLVDVVMDATFNSDKPLTAERLFGWHSALFPLGRSGMHRITVADWRKGEEPMLVVSGAYGHEIIHFEAPPSDAVESEMDCLINWCNRKDISPYIMAAVAHLWFVTIHPFDDGNGRLGRSLADMLLARTDVESARYYSVSKEINMNKKAYYEMLERTQKGSLNVTPWILFFFDMVECAIKRSLEAVEHTVRKALFWEKYSDVAVNERQRKIINRLWDGFEGKLTTSKWAKMCSCSQDTALRDINDLINNGLLRKNAESGRNTNYCLNI